MLAAVRRQRCHEISSTCGVGTAPSEQGKSRRMSSIKCFLYICTIGSYDISACATVVSSGRAVRPSPFTAEQDVAFRVLTWPFRGAQPARVARRLLVRSSERRCSCKPLVKRAPVAHRNGQGTFLHRSDEMQDRCERAAVLGPPCHAPYRWPISAAARHHQLATLWDRSPPRTNDEG